MINALILGEIMWESRLKCGLLCKNKIVTIFLLIFFIPQNGTYLKKTRLVCLSLWKPKVQYCIHTQHIFHPYLSLVEQINNYFFKIHIILSPHLVLRFPSRFGNWIAFFIIRICVEKMKFHDAIVTRFKACCFEFTLLIRFPLGE